MADDLGSLLVLDSDMEPQKNFTICKIYKKKKSATTFNVKCFKNSTQAFYFIGAELCRQKRYQILPKDISITQLVD